MVIGVRYKIRERSGEHVSHGAGGGRSNRVSTGLPLDLSGAIGPKNDERRRRCSSSAFVEMRPVRAKNSSLM